MSRIIRDSWTLYYRFIGIIICVPLVEIIVAFVARTELVAGYGDFLVGLSSVCVYAFVLRRVLACYIFGTENVPQPFERPDGGELRRVSVFAVKFSILSILARYLFEFSQHAITQAIHDIPSKHFLLWNSVPSYSILDTVIFCLTLALLGTWLPADVYGRNTGIGQAIGRGIRSFGPTLGRLTVPAALYLIPFVAWLLVAQHSAQDSPFGLTLTLEFAAFAVVAYLIALLKVFALVIAGIILTRSYLGDLEEVVSAGAPAGAAPTSD